MVPTGFWSKLTCQGWEEFSLRNLPSALNLMGDWCGVRREVASVIVRDGKKNSVVEPAIPFAVAYRHRRDW